MRYGNIVYNKRNGRLNLGDDIQLLAIEQLYKEMGIDYADVVRIELSDLYNWTGEDVIMPISFPIIGYGSHLNITCFSQQIHPVFLALSILAETLSLEDVEYLNRYSPIGCRDYHTYSIMKKYSIPAYLFGCMTLTMPQRWKESQKTNKVYCVDVSERLKQYMPHELKKECIYLSNAYNIDELDTSPEDKAREMYEMFIHEAKLVITSRMHVALPCIAAGIPVIFAKDVYSYRFAGVNRIVKVYDELQYEKIDWSPQPLEFHKVKMEMLELAKKRVVQAYEQYSAISSYEKIYNEEINNYGVVESVESTKKYLEQQYGFNDEFKYALWSVTQTANVINEMIKKKWRKAELVAVIDRSKEIEFDGIISGKKENLLNNSEVTVLVCSDAAIKEAREFFENNGIQEFFFCCQAGMPIK